MRSQSEIRRDSDRQEGLAKISALLDRERLSNRSDLGRRVCEVFDFPQWLGCLNALRAI